VGATGTGNSTKLFLNQPLSNGAWVGFASGTTIGTAGAATKAVAFGDVDGDHDLDLVLGNDGSNSLLYFNDGAGVFATPATLDNAATRAVAMADVNGDG